MATLMQRVVSHTTGQKTSGQNTLALIPECVDHMFGESGDWTPLAALIGRSEPRQSRLVAAIVGQVVMGWTKTKDASVKNTGGVRFKKKKGANVGIDSAKMDVLRTLVDRKLSIQSEDVRKELLPSTKAAEKPLSGVAQTKAKNIAKFIHDHDGLKTADFMQLVAEELQKMQK